jgi:uncharacterized metal-binding protein YceD (DUF177 family)
MSKLTFNIVEIPEGDSSKKLMLQPEDLDLSPHDFEGGDIGIDFYRARHFIRISYDVQADVTLVCDRSLEEFIYPADTSYEVVFKTDVEEETENEGGAVRRFNFSSNTFSIEKEVRDSVMLQVPMQKIHPRYLNADGELKNFEIKSFGEGPTEEEKQATDPRWDKLKQLKEDN